MLRNYPQGRILLIGILLLLLTLATYLPVRHHDFVDYDDDDYITENPHVLKGITWESFLWVFTRYHSGNWHPLPWLSHMLDVECFGLNPSGHHLTNLWLHIANTILLFLLFRSMTGALWRSFFVAAVFALHPLHVESVAWAAERKDVLSTLFELLTIAAYLSYVRRGGWGRYLLIIFFFSLALMAKPMLVTLPLVLLILDWWPLCRWFKDRRSRNLISKTRNTSKTGKLPKVDFPPASISRLITEKIPLFILVIITCIVTYTVQQSSGGMGPTKMSLRIQNALVSYVAYLGKMFWPVDLAVLYPFPINGLPSWKPVAALLLLMTLSILFFYHRRRRRYLLAGWLWYLGTLVPVIGVIQVGAQAMADRYTYFPLIGVFMMLSWTMAELLSGRRHGKIILSSVTILLIIAMLIGTRTQLQYWRNSNTLYEHALAVTRDNYIMHYNLGLIKVNQGREEEAKSHFQQVVQIYPLFDKAHYYLGLRFKRQGQLDEAIACFRRALLVNPTFIKAYGMLASILEEQGRLDEAIRNYRMVLQIQPDFADNINNLAWILATATDSNIRNPTEALELASRACELTAYKNPHILDTLAAAYATADQFDDAVETAQAAVALAEASNQTNLAKNIRNRLQLYQTGRAYYESASIEEVPMTENCN